mgnify:CR=1 FL=1|tara:strand:- start:1229 stop:1555 length:327 start_codon:yes stop_codon:yes gene_type:complete
MKRPSEYMTMTDGVTQHDYKQALNKYIDYLEAQLEQLILSGVSNWVAISDRKPPKEWSNYMVCLENNSIFQANYCRIGTERWLIVGVGEITNENPVLYWMEEPKPPCC